MAIKDKVVTQKGKKGHFSVFPGLCKGCGLCAEKCPVSIIQWSKNLGVYGTPIVEVSDADKCTACKMCEIVCPDCAITIEKVGKK